MGISKSLLMVALIAFAISVAKAEENYESWRLHTPTFPSTGGGGVVIGEYDPVIAGDKCKTDFTATLPDGKVYYNTVEFDAVPAQGGTLCTANGAPATAVPPARRPIRCSSRTVWCAARRNPPVTHPYCSVLALPGLTATQHRPRIALGQAQPCRIAAPPA
jgi:hypothetical protein